MNLSRFAFASLLLFALVSSTASHPDEFLKGADLISGRNFPVEEHEVQTEDKYWLHLFRIPRQGAPVVFLQHGVVDSSDTWLLSPPSQSLAFILYQKGYDVWLGNSRGNKYGNVHETLSSKDPAFWEFDWDQMAEFDIPACINYVLATAKKDTLVYVGHSQGTTIAFANFATDSSVSSKISFYAALAPVTNVGHVQSPLLRALALGNTDNFMGLFLDNVFNRNQETFLSFVLPKLCRFLRLHCDTIIDVISGPQGPDLDRSRLPVILSHFPSGTSVRNFQHWAEAARTDTFATYENKPYVLSGKNLPPTALFYGTNDWLATVEDVETGTIPKIPKQSLVFAKKYPGYTHLDFIWGQYVYTTVYKDLLDLLKVYAPSNINHK